MNRTLSLQTFVIGLILVQITACVQVTPTQLADSPGGLGPSKHASSLSERVDAAYIAVADRFQIRCYLSLAAGSVQDAALMPVESAEATLTLRPYSVKIAVSYPSASEASEQILPAPFFYYDYEVRRDAKVLARHTRRRSQSHTLPIEIAGEPGDHRCLLLPLPSDPILLTGGQRPLVHINVHPHRNFDPTGLLSGRIEPLLMDPSIKSFVLFEAQNLPFNLSALLPGVPQATYPFWDPMQGVALQQLGDAVLVIAPQGEFSWAPANKGNFPSRIVMTGGFFKACLTRQLAFVNDAFGRSDATLLNLIYIDQLILRQPSNDLGMPSELGAIPSEPAAAREEGETSFLKLLSAFNKSYGLDDSGLEYRFSYSVLEGAKSGACDPHAVDLEQTVSGDASKKLVVFNMVQCL